ncbi:MAG: hypothetical protein RL238_2900 [Actinomycetota bacterium]
MIELNRAVASHSDFVMGFVEAALKPQAYRSQTVPEEAGTDCGDR